MNWNEFTKKIENTLEDLTTLEVATLTGTLEVSREPGQPQEVVFKDLLKELGKQATVTSNIQVVAYTHIDFDHDSVNFVASGAEDKPKLLEAHGKMVSASAEARSAFLSFVRDLLPG